MVAPLCVNRDYLSRASQRREARIKIEDKTIADSTLRPWCATATTFNCRSLSLSEIWLESMQQIRLLCSRCLGIRITHRRANWVKTWQPQNRKYIRYRNAARGGRDWATATVNRPVHWNLAKFGHVVFYICARTDRNTHHSTRHPFRGRSKNKKKKLKQKTYLDDAWSRW